MKEILEKLAKACTDHKAWSYDDDYNRPVGTNDLERMKEEIINEMGEMLQNILNEEK